MDMKGIGSRAGRLRGAVMRFAGTALRRPAVARTFGYITRFAVGLLLPHGIVLGGAKCSIDERIALIDTFLPHVDNWAVCDALKPKVFAKHKTELLPHIERWIDSPLPYTCRFGLEMLMTHFLDDDFKPEYAMRPLAVTSDEYYVRMMVAWFYATALAKQRDAVIPLLEQRLLPEWTHRKAIQKACESYRVTPEQKEYLKSLK